MLDLLKQSLFFRLSSKVHAPVEECRIGNPRDPNTSTSKSRGRKKDKKKVYETLQMATQGQSSEDENPYTSL
jgi:hypothetical protein